MFSARLVALNTPHSSVFYIRLRRSSFKRENIH
jgi:hypothetical protein